MNFANQVTTKAERDKHEEQRLAEFRALGLVPTYRASVEFENGGSLTSGFGLDAASALRKATKLAQEWDRSAAYQGAKVVWFGAELENPKKYCPLDDDSPIGQRTKK